MGTLDFFGSSMVEIAARFASFRVWLYRSIIFRLMWAASAMIELSEACPSAMVLTKVWRISCQRQETFAESRAAVQATFQDPMGLSG